jgi:hypothetical protein
LPCSRVPTEKSLMQEDVVLLSTPKLESF